MNEDILNRMSDAIEQLLAEMRAPAQVVEGWLTPGLMTFRLKPVSGTRVDAVMRLRKDLELTLRAPYVRIGRQIGYITVQVPNGAPDVYLDDMLRNTDLFAGAPAMTAPLGIGEDGTPILLHVGNNTSNILISGLMGSGKTTLAHSLLIGLCARQSPRAMRLVLCDPKRHDLAWMRQWIGGNLDGAIRHEPDEIAAAIADVAQRVEQARDRARETVLFIDELGWVLNQSPASIEPLKRIMKRGRECGFRVIACEPVPGTAPLAGDTLASFHVRITGRQADAGAAYNATGVKDSGSENLTGAGDMLAVHFGQVTRFRAVRPPKGFEGQRLMPALELEAPRPAPLPASISVDIPSAAPIVVSTSEDADTWVETELDADRREFVALTVGDKCPTLAQWAAARFEMRFSDSIEGERLRLLRARFDAAWNDKVARGIAQAVGTDADEYVIASRMARESLNTARGLLQACKSEKREGPALTEADEDIRVLAELAAGGPLPGVKAWAAARFRAFGWRVAYAGDRCVWMRLRHEEAVKALTALTRENTGVKAVKPPPAPPVSGVVEPVGEGEGA
jgi:hypothetical protein